MNVATHASSGRGRGFTSPHVSVGRLLLTLYVVLFLFLLVLPVLLVIVVSFSPSPYLNFPVQHLSWTWYRRVIAYQPFMSSLLTSVEIAFLSAMLGALFALPSALAIARSTHPLAGGMVIFLLSPISIPGIVLGFSLLYFLSATAFGAGFAALLVAHTVVAIPYIARTVISVYRTIPASTEDAAIILGATRLQTLRLVTLPQLRQALFAGILFAFLISLDNLPISYFFSTSSTATLPVVMMSYLESQFDPSIAAIATLQTAIAVVGLLLADRIYGIAKLSPT